MSAEVGQLRAAALGLALLCFPATAQAQSSVLAIELREAPEPDSQAWEDPARIALTIDPDGPDRFSAQIDLEISKSLVASTPERFLPRSKSVGGYVRWNRETGGDDRQNNFETGLVFKVGQDVARLLDLSAADLSLTNAQLADLADRRARRVDYSFRSSTGYARTANYPDDTADCETLAQSPQCGTQFDESLRSSASIGLFSVFLENRRGNGLGYSIDPKFGVDHDLILNSPIDAETGIETKGGYLSAVAGLSATLTPTFINPGWEIEGAFQLRQRIDASSSRRSLIERTAERIELSATY